MYLWKVHLTTRCTDTVKLFNSGVNISSSEKEAYSAGSVGQDLLKQQFISSICRSLEMVNALQKSQ